MTAQILSLFDNGNAPEHLVPSLHVTSGGPISSGLDARRNYAKLAKDMSKAWAFADRNKLPVLTVAGDRNGAYIVVSPTSYIGTLFQEEPCCWRKEPAKNGCTIEHWLALFGEIRVFWRVTKCAH